MKRNTRLFIPKSHVVMLTKTIALSFGSQIQLKVMEPSPLDLDGLKCFHLRFRGSLMQSRAPFVYPLMVPELHPYHQTDKGKFLHEAYGADWVYLGGGMELFMKTLAEHFLSSGVRHLEVHPYTEVGGTFARQPQRGDLSVTVIKKPCFHNDTQVQKVKDKLLGTAPEDWDRNDYCLVEERYSLIEPMLQRYLTSKPGTIIELGCGLGRVADKIAELYPEARVIGYDFSEHSIEVCKRSFHRDNLEFAVADFTEPLPHADKEIDLIVSIAALNMSSVPAVTAAECFRVLSDKGLMVNHSLSETAYTCWDYPASLFMPTHMNTFPTDWFYAARAAGHAFRIVPWNLQSFTFQACRNKEFSAAHRKFMQSRNADPHFLPFHDRFTMLVGAGVENMKPQGMDRHLVERNHLDYAGQCLESFDMSDEKLANMRRWAASIVRTQLQLLPETDAFLKGIMPESDFSIFSAQRNQRMAS